MIKQLILLAVTILFFQQSIGQNDKQIRKYYALVNQAELSIIDNKLPEAKKKYEEAFNTQYGFPSDKYNAFVVSYFMKDTLKSIKYFNDLANLGQDKEKLIKYFLKTDKIPDDPYLEYITRNYDSIHNKVMSGTMPVLAAKMDRLYEMDQECRRRNLDNTELKACDIVVRDSIYDFIETHGFPNAQNVGLLEKGVIQATNIDHFDLILYHSRGLPLDTKIFQIALQNVKDGSYDARRFSLAFGYPDSDYPVLIPYNPVTRKELDEINKKRAEIYLEPMEDYYRKVAFHTKNQKYYKQNYVFLDPFMCMFALNIPLQILE